MDRDHDDGELRSSAEVRAALEASAASTPNLIRRVRLRTLGRVSIVDLLWIVPFALVFGRAGALVGLVIPIVTIAQAISSRAYVESGRLHVDGFDRAAYRLDTLVHLERVGDRIRLAFTHGPDGSPANPALEIDAVEPLVRLLGGRARVSVDRPFDVRAA